MKTSRIWNTLFWWISCGVFGMSVGRYLWYEQRYFQMVDRHEEDLRGMRHDLGNAEIEIYQRLVDVETTMAPLWRTKGRKSP